MNMFYVIVLGIAITFLILVLTFMGIMMRKQTSTAVYPPTSFVCPDYWTSDNKGNCTMPTQISSSNNGAFVNSGGQPDLGKNSNIAPFSKDSKSFNVNNLLWSSGGKSTLCAQKDWATQNNIIWDGVSNYNGCKSTN